MTKQILKRKILYITGTRADFGKLKPIISITEEKYENHIFVTGMHMLSRHGLTWNEVVKFGHGDLHPYVNQKPGDELSQILAKTIAGLTDIVNEIKPNLIVIHGDRVEALAGALVGSLTGTLTSHIEGGEISGTIDEMIRHSISKLVNKHFVSNEDARDLLLQMGEEPSSIHVIGSPEIDIMLSNTLPTLEKVKSRYKIDFARYAIAVLHPVVTEIAFIKQQAKDFFGALEKSKLQFVVIEPNNDPGADYIFEEIQKYKNNENFKVIPSMRFEFYLTLLRESQFIVGNSSSGVRESSVFGTPAINVGSRQNGRVKSNLVIDVDNKENAILKAIEQVLQFERIPFSLYGQGKSSKLFLSILSDEKFWSEKMQKVFLKHKLDTAEARNKI